MKKLLSIVVIAVAVTAVAAEKTVATVGVTAITSSKQHTIVSVPYTELGTGGNICVSNLIKTANLDLGDIVEVVLELSNIGVRIIDPLHCTFQHGFKG